MRFQDTISLIAQHFEIAMTFQDCNETTFQCCFKISIRTLITNKTLITIPRDFQIALGL